MRSTRPRRAPQAPDGARPRRNTPPRARALAPLLAAALAACATLGHDDYDRARTLDQFARDSAECEMLAAESRNAGGLTGALGFFAFLDKRDRVYDPCMRAKGYARK